MFTKDVYLVNKYSNNYFEGWYSKIDDGKNIFTTIFGFSKTKEDEHAFIQIFNNNDYKMHYFKFDLNKCNFSKYKLKVEIEDNYLTSEGMYINLKNKEIDLIIDVKFKELKVLEKKPFRPNIMGPVSYLPKVECNHTLISMHHFINGQITYNNSNIKLVNALGYMEKDYGTSMPKWWVWTHMNDIDSSFMISIAKVKYLIHDFDGTLGFFYIDNKYFIFATYTGFKINSLYEEKNSTIIKGEDKNIKLKLEIIKKGDVILKAPTNGKMNRDIKEGVSGISKLKITDKQNKKEYYKEYQNVAIELVGDINYKRR